MRKSPMALVGIARIDALQRVAVGRVENVSSKGQLFMPAVYWETFLARP